MPRIVYKRKRFGEAALAVIARVNRVLDDYAEQGFDLTLRQVYYQCVARGWIPNLDREYKKLGSIINDARLSGLIDWDHIVDRTRNLRSVSHWGEPDDIIRSAAASFRLDKWATQPERLEVWIEKDALVGVIGGVCNRLDVPYFSCRGYVSQSEMWAASQRLGQYVENGQIVRILHLGDHDPSGLDMSRDIEERIFMFLANDHYQASGADDDGNASVEWISERFFLHRLALNMDQIKQYQPPPNPAKVTDSRAAGYIREHGRESWELDALEPTVIANLIEEAVLAHRDETLWDEAVAEEVQHRAALAEASRRWADVAAWLNGGHAA